VAFRDLDSKYLEEWQSIDGWRGNAWSNGDNIEFLGWDNNGDAALSDVVTTSSPVSIPTLDTTFTAVYNATTGMYDISWTPVQDSVWSSGNVCIMKNDGTGAMTANWIAYYDTGSASIAADTLWADDAHNETFNIMINKWDSQSQVTRYTQMSPAILPFGGIPNTPVSVTATFTYANPSVAGSTCGVVVSWTDSSDQESYYTVQSSIDGGMTWVTVNPLLTDPGRIKESLNYTTYWTPNYVEGMQFRVCAINEDPMNSDNFFWSDWRYSNSV
jgi:hypothetical protein